MQRPALPVRPSAKSATEHGISRQVALSLSAVLVVVLAVAAACASPVADERPHPSGMQSYLLALGDSYTIGSGVSPQDAFPRQTVERLPGVDRAEIIARLGWTTDNLLTATQQFAAEQSAVEQSAMAQPEFVTLLIGVNNQFQQRDFSLYKEQFPALLAAALGFVDNDPARVVTLSIPDYRYTPYGQNRNLPEAVSQEIDAYNSFARHASQEAGVHFLDITGLSRQGLDRPELVASDDLHLSAIAYAEIAHRIVEWRNSQ
ncbi:SGNH/GDSL hydrolase family protein [Spirochaeta africana]|uniref:Lysophospholipase L1-like esterase n=1 Tax=Spirochaeta africana (strain ATCC 700263 / DSM 8902 / Z-7692) TaxID=889378 RepID=H9UHJ7_SPIAZ|nr:SGNH/GDSL hydrolase family protein [Spirochaeta africana]AFG36990.1 lysophospholipase L1-like esterase [Spirochaeta africana DSM 8902]